MAHHYHHSPRRRRWAAAITAMVAALSGAVLSPARAQSPGPESPIAYLGELDLYGGVTHPVTGDRQLLRAWELLPNQRLIVAVVDNSTVLVSDIDTLGHVWHEENTLDALDARSSAIEDRDPASTTVFFGGSSTGTTSGVPRLAIMPIDRSGYQGVTTTDWPNLVDDSAAYFHGLVYDRGTDLLYAVSNGDNYASFHSFDASKLRSSDAATRQAALLWSYALPACKNVRNAGFGRQSPIGISDRGFLYFMCGAEVGRQSTAFATRLNLADDPADFEVEQFPVAAEFGQNGFSIVDHGGDRIVALVASAGAQKALVFDAAHRAWTGSVPINTANFGGAAVNPLTHRVYVATDETGLMWVSELDRTSVPVGQDEKLFNGDGDHMEGPRAGLLMDPVTRRVFVPEYLGEVVDEDTETTERRVLVFEDHVPPIEEANEPHPDQATASTLSESDDNVGVNYGTEGSGYGLRHQLVGGLGEPDVNGNTPYHERPGGLLLAGEEFDPAFVVINDCRAENVPHPVTRVELLGWTGHPDRSGTRMAGTQDGASEARADAARIGFDPDTGAEKDRVLGDPASGSDCWQDGGTDDGDDRRGGNGPVDGRFGVAQCSAARAEDTWVSQAPGAEVSCQVSKEIVTAASVAAPKSDDANLPDNEAYLTVGNARSTNRLVRKTGEGATARAEAIAEGVRLSLPGVGSLHISRVTAVAEAHAAGRTGTAGSTWETSVHGARILGPDGDVVWECDNCTPYEVADEANQYFPTFIDVAPGRRDNDAKVTGSRGGAQARVIKDPYQIVSDTNTNNDDSVEVPALEITIYHDSDGPSRDVVSLAAVYAEAKYQLFPLGSGFDPGTSGGTGVAEPAIEITLTDPSGSPLPGGVFVAHVDGAGEVGRCTTDDSGFCGMTDLPTGDYTVSEPTAPSGYEAADPIPFALTSTGQVAELTVVNVQSRGDQSGGDGDVRPATGSTSGSDGQVVIRANSSLGPQPPGDGGSTGVAPWITQPIRDLLRFAVRSPWHAFLVGCLLSLLGLPVYLTRRRRLLLVVRGTP